MIYAFRTEKGFRKQNEDACRIPNEGDKPLVIVADGMGGHLAGSIASRTAVDTICSYVENSNDDCSSTLMLRRAVNYANRSIFDAAQLNDDCSGMGTTIVLALLGVRSVSCAHVGDSRLYLFDGKRLVRKTKDHSYVQELVDSGNITDEQAMTHPQRNILTRAVGTSRFEKVDVNTFEWKLNDMLLLCSDGLHGSVADSVIESILRSESDLLKCCDSLVETALNSGSRDNITVVIVKNTEVIS